ncbi:hypothetical protein Dolphis_13 [Pseudomonas phage Dolphis]|nr:hypothetical protein Dolphis_13 [Pseudomonas phage Dolphis]
MRFNPNRFDRHLANMGQDIKWRPSFACSCFNLSSGAPDPKCKLCVGKGRIWEVTKDTVCGVCKQDTQAEWADSGLWESGDLVVTIPQSSPMWDAGQFDRVTMMNATDRFSQPLQRGAPTERLLFVPKSIDRVFWRHPQTQAMVTGGIPVVDASGNLTWPNGGEPPMGMTYSLSGWRHSEYFVFGNFPSNRNMHQGMRLPKRVVLRRWDLFGR